MLLASNGAVMTVWAVSIAAGLAVVLLTAFLLALLLRTTRQIDRRTLAIRAAIGRIGAAGMKLALLGRVNETCTELVDAGSGIAMATSRIMMHAAVCPGCPRCATAPPGRVTEGGE